MYGEDEMLPKARENRHDNVRDTERDMGDEDCPEPAVHVAGDEQHEERNADEDVRHDERRIDERMVQ